MELNEIDEYHLNTEIKYQNLSEQTAEYIISEYRKLGPYHKCDDNPLASLLYNYFYLKKKGKHQVLEEVLNNYKINYKSSIHNAIFDLLGSEKDKSLLWPGVVSEEDDGLLYKLKTNIGIIKVYKASEIFKNTKSAYIFKRNLRNCCHVRSFDFLSENKDYKAVLSYDNNLFVGGHFHSYLEKDDITIDIAGNALYKSREDKEKVLNGEVLAKLTYDEVMIEFMKVLEEIPNLDPDDDKLQVLALYYGKKKGIK